MSEYHLLPKTAGRAHVRIHDAGPACYADCRPVVVLDPEGEQVERLAAMVWARNDVRTDAEVFTKRFRNALRDLARPTPPRPEEPTGLGAVVEDDEGVDWHRTADGRWIAGDGLRSRASGWDLIEAVRVLSPGVEAS